MWLPALPSFHCGQVQEDRVSVTVDDSKVKQLVVKCFVSAWIGRRKKCTVY